MRRTVARLLEGKPPIATSDTFADRISGIADSLTQLLSEAATRNLMTPPPISNSVHDLRGWAACIRQGSAVRPTVVDATRLLAYLRGLSDHQLLALLAELPWSRLDVLLDTVNTTTPPLARSPRS
jgi:hypothetical protein